jgi:copper chaperone CopZ
MRRIGLFLFFVVAAGAAISVLPCCALSPTASAAPPPAKVATLNVEKMTCGGCAISVKVVVKKIDGVKDVNVSYEDKKAVVTYDPRLTSAESIAATINEKLPYVAAVLSDEVTGE